MTRADPVPSARWIALAGVWLAYCAFGATASSLAPLIPEIRAELGMSNAAMGAVLGAWPLVYIAVAIPAGALLDAIGVQTGVFLATLAIAASALLRAVADTPVELLMAVAVFGVGGPLISVGAPKLITTLFEGRSRGTAIGFYMTGPNVGAILTLTLTSAVLMPLTGESWRAVMVIHAGFAVFAGVVWLICARLARISASGPARERFEPKALKSILSQTDVLIVLAMAVGVFYVNHALNNWLPAILRNTGMAAEAAGFWAAVPTLVGLAAALTIPRMATGGRRLPMLIAVFAAACGASLLIATGQGATLTAGLLLQGIVRGAMNSIAILVLVELPSIPKSRIGLASGVFFAAGEVGGVLGPFTFGVLRDATGGFHAPLYSLTAITVVMIVLALVLMARRDR